jgi:ubiquinone/menaquinone biosynthesis C-methylase UbiE
MSGPNTGEARERYNRYAPTYDRQLKSLRRIQEGIRHRAIDQLNLASGDAVLDVGCGTGASFAALVDAVGPAGRVIGVDQSEGMLREARRRVERHGWRNVDLIEAPVQDAAIPSGVDAALFFFTHDLLQTPTALENVLDSLQPGGRVVTAGARRPAPWIVPLVLPVLLLIRRYVTTSQGLAQPWKELEDRVPEIDVKLSHLGVIYVAIATKASA